MARDLPGSRLKARRRRRRAILALGIALGIIIIGGSLIGSTWIPVIRIHTVSVKGASAVNEGQIKEVALRDLAGTYRYLIPKNNIFLYPAESIKNDLLGTFPALERVEIARSSFGSIEITVAERQTAALWCGASMTNPSPCFVLDKAGVAYAPAANFSGEVYIKYFGPVTGNDAKQYLTSGTFYELASFVEAVRVPAMSEKPRSVEVVGTDVNLVFGSGFVLKFSLKDSGADVLDRFKLALGAAPFISRPLSDFEYLDLRFGDKVYYMAKSK
jgi:hypothetical protein